MGKLVSLSDAVALVSDGSSLGIGGILLRRKPMSLIKEIIRRKLKGLTFYSFLGSLDVDLLLGAGVGQELYTCYVGFEHLGLAPVFGRLAKEGSLELHEHSEFSYITGLRAAMMGLPFLPTRGLLGSQLIETLGLRTVTCPYSGEYLPAVPAFTPDVAILHAGLADIHGNIYAPEIPDFLQEHDYTLARAARKVIVSVERVVDEKEALALAPRIAIFSYEIDLVVEAPCGALPTGQTPYYDANWAQVQEYLELARTPEGFQTYLERFLVG